MHGFLGDPTNFLALRDHLASRGIRNFLSFSYPPRLDYQRLACRLGRMVEAVCLATGVVFENDVNLAALGEQARGLGRTLADFVYLWVGTGIGTGTSGSNFTIPLAITGFSPGSGAVGDTITVTGVGFLSMPPHGWAKFGDDEVWYLQDAIPEGHSAAVALIEHRWAIPLRDKIAKAGGLTLSDAWIHVADLVAVGALAKAKAEA